MEIIAKAKYIRMSPRKIRLVANLVKKMKVGEAFDQLKFLKKLATKPVAKLLNSAVANAEHNFNLERDNLYLKEITVNEGPTLHRFMPRAHGRATAIRKRTSHINLVLAEIKASAKAKAVKKDIAAPIKMDAKPREESVKIKKEAIESKDKKVPVKSFEEKGKVISEPDREGRVGHTKIEGGRGRGFVNKIFRRKSG